MTLQSGECLEPMNTPGAPLTVVQCHGRYLRQSENWIYRMMVEMPNVRSIIVAREFLKENFYPNRFDYLEFPLRSLRDSGVRIGLAGRVWNGFVWRLGGAVYPGYVARMLRGRSVALVHAHFSWTGWQYRALAKRLGVPLVVSFYGCDYECLPTTEPVWHRRYQLLFEQAAGFICEGPHGARVLQGMGCPPKKVRVVRLGVDTQAIPVHVRDKQPGELRLLQVANLSEKKGHIFALKAFIAALEECPNMSFTMVGRGGGGGIRSELELLVQEAGVQDKVKFLDWIDWRAIHEFLRGFHVFIHPSCYSRSRDCEGGAPVVLLDAQATGMPVIATTHCDIPDEVIHGTTGLLSEEKDTQSLTQAVTRFYRMGLVEYQAFAQASRRHVVAHFNIRTNAIALESVYRDLLTCG